ncbi:MAG: Fic family protein [Proteobacteria bacterium]|nr:Fic family protein [Pseudomonadota bacterium]
MSVYIHELPDWPQFHWSQEALAQRLAALRYRQGQLIGRMETMGFSFRSEAVFQTLTLDVLKSSEIEGEILNREEVRSSIARHLGMDIGTPVSVSGNVEGAVEMMIDATQKYDKPLTKERLFGWHTSLFPSGYSGMRKIKVGDWRDDDKGPMQVVSGPVGHQRVHFEAPAAHRIEGEMSTFLDWFNNNGDTDLVLRACIAHLWFVTIHPFEDGNGRIARALADMMLARSEQSSQRFYSLSAQIQIERNAYYIELEKAQKGTLDITVQIEWFLDCLNRAFDGVDSTLATVFRKARFREMHAGAPINDRQRLILNNLLDGFEGKLTSSKWAKLAKCSQDTALRDILHLVELGILLKDIAGGRSTSYSLIFP